MTDAKAEEEWARKKQKNINNRLYLIQQELHAIAKDYHLLRDNTIEAAVSNAADDLEEIERLQSEIYTCQHTDS